MQCQEGDCVGLILRRELAVELLCCHRQKGGEVLVPRETDPAEPGPLSPGLEASAALWVGASCTAPPVGTLMCLCFLTLLYLSSMTE